MGSRGDRASVLQRRTVGLASAALVALTLVTLLPVAPTVRTAISLVLLGACSGTAAVASLLTARRITGRDRRTFGTISASLAAWTTGVAIQFGFVLSVGHWPEGPSAEDIAFLVALLFLMPAAAEFGDPASASKIRRGAATVDLLAMLTLGALIVYLLLIRPLGFAEPGSNVLRAAILQAYVALTGALFLYPLVFRHEPWTTPAALAVAGWGAGSFTSLAIVLGLGLHVYSASSPSAALINIPFAASFCLLGAAAVWRATMVPGGSPGPQPSDELPRWPGIVVSVASLLGIPVAIAISLVSADHQTEVVTAALAALLSTLIIARNLLLVIENRRGVERQGVSERYRAIVESAPSAILVVDAEGKILFANPAAALVLGASSPYDLLGVDLGTLLPSPVAIAEVEAEVRALIRALVTGRDQSRQSSPLRLTRLLTLGGEFIDMHRTAAAILYDGIPAVIIQGEDVTAKLRAEHEAQLHQERLREMSTELVATEDRERRALAEALHDRVGQALAISRIRLKLAASDGLAGGSDVDTAVEMIEEAIAETRMLTTELAPTVLYQHGLAPALRQLCDGFVSGHGLVTELVVEGVEGEELPEDCRAIVYRAVRELLMNTLKHAQATRVLVTLERDAQGTTVVVHDDGVGFDVYRTPRRSFGLLSVGESLRTHGGALEIDSTPGKGTTARVTVGKQ